ncbi:MAG: hypothetical protein K9M13_02045 [Simkaniaceae bacterium]|nr:hypothetical protein [Simkaniaceae bacterium]
MPKYEVSVEFTITVPIEVEADDLYEAEHYAENKAFMMSKEEILHEGQLHVEGAIPGVTIEFNG